MLLPISSCSPEIINILNSAKHYLAFIYTHNTLILNTMLFSFIWKFMGKKHQAIGHIFYLLLYLPLLYNSFITTLIGWKTNKYLVAHVLPLRIFVAFGLFHSRLSLAFKTVNALVLAEFNFFHHPPFQSSCNANITYFPTSVFLFDQFLSSSHIPAWGNSTTLHSSAHETDLDFPSNSWFPQALYLSWRSYIP